MTYRQSGSARRYQNSNGYWIIRAVGHPVAHADGDAYEHRVVLFARVGPGVHPCHWCARAVEWFVDLETDHVDHDPSNNAEDNLVVSCRSCNVVRNRRWAEAQTHCRRAGHELTPENTYVVPTTGARQCRACGRERKAEYKRRNVKPCHGCGRTTDATWSTSSRYCDDCQRDPLRAVGNVPECCGNGHELSGDNLTFVRASSRSNRMRWRCVRCTREKSYAAYLRRKTAASK